MKIHATFAWLEGAEGPSLIHAWDEYDIDSNRAGYDAELAEAISGSDIADLGGVPMVRTVHIEIDYDALEKLFLKEPVLAGELIQPAPNAEEQTHG